MGIHQEKLESREERIGDLTSARGVLPKWSAKEE